MNQTVKRNPAKKIGKKNIFIAFAAFVVLFGAVSLYFNANSSQESVKTFWDFQSIDTMKYSRDLAREKLNDPRFDVIIDRQMRSISETGATHVAIATPYDEEFLPILKRWVNYARKYNLNVWFRGNFSGWEGWFEYNKISREEHKGLLKKFIAKNPDIFEDGDKFTSCPECENGGPGDPRHNGDVLGFRNFMIEEYEITNDNFRLINKKVDSNYNSMNGDVAELIMDKNTTKALNGIVVVDHYVKDPEKMNDDINRYAQKSGGKIVLGEFGAPIPDINGKMSEIEQKEWIEKTMYLLSKNENLVGLNYWTSTGGSTELWDSAGIKKAGADALKAAYQPMVINIEIKNYFGRRINKGHAIYDERKVEIKDGTISIPTIKKELLIKIESDNYETKEVVANNRNNVIILKSKNPSLAEKLFYFFSKGSR